MQLKLVSNSLEEKIISIENHERNIRQSDVRETESSFWFTKWQNHSYQMDWKEAVVVWDRDDYAQEVEKKLGDKEIYEEERNDPKLLIDTIHKAVKIIRKRGDLSAVNIKCFMLGFFYCRKSGKRLRNILGRPVVIYYGFYTENVSISLDFWLQFKASLTKMTLKVF